MLKDLRKDIEGKMKKTIESVQREFSEVRTGRAHPGLIEGLHVDYYGTPTPLKQVASISIPDSRTVAIQPWEPSLIVEIEKAIANSKLGITPNNDGKIVRLNIPSLSEERREDLKKITKEMAEHGRVSLRTIRREANDQIKKLKSDSKISEDDKFRSEDEIQKLTDRYIEEIDKILEKKNKELTEMH